MMAHANDIADAFMAGEWCAANRRHTDLHRITYNNWLVRGDEFARAFTSGYRGAL